MKYFEARKARIEIIPMIDIMFFLLVFFIMLTLHMIPNAGMKTELPTSAVAAALPPPTVLVTLSADGNVSVDGHDLSAAALTAMLRARSDASRTVVTIAGAKQATVQKLIDTMDACREAGVSHVALAAQPAAQ